VVLSSDPSGTDSSVGSQVGAPIFMCDASAEAERLSGGLRARGYAVVDVPLGLLAGRAAVQRPALVVCDADAPGTRETIERMRAAAGEREIDVLLLGEAVELSVEDRAALERAASGTFARPVNADELATRVEQLIGPPSTAARSSSGSSSGRPPVLVAATRRPYRYEGPKGGSSPHSAAPPPPPPVSSGRGAAWSSSPPNPGLRNPSIAPHGVPQGVGPMPHARLSPELELLLGRAEQRVRQAPQPIAAVERLSPDAEVDALLPAELLAALDEPLDDDEDDDDGDDSVPGTHSGSESGTKGTKGTSSDAGAGTAPGPRSTGRSEPFHSTIGGEAPAPPPPSAIPAEPPPPAADPSTTPPARPTREPPPSVTGLGDADLDDIIHDSMPMASPYHEPPEHRPSEVAQQVSTKPPQLASARPAPPAPFVPAEPVRSEQFVPQPTPLPPRSEPRSAGIEIPHALGEGDALRALAKGVAGRFTGGFAFEDDTGIRRVVLRDGDFVTVASGAETESLVAFLTQRGDLAAEVAQRAGRRLPQFGRHAGAALVAQGHLRQDELWSVLRAHAEWLLARVVSMRKGAANVETEVPQRLQAEPGVFGGATGAEVLIEVARRVVVPNDALARLGGRDVRVSRRRSDGLLAECALPDSEVQLIKQSAGLRVSELLERGGTDDFACVLWGLVELGVLDVEAGPKREETAAKNLEPDPLDTAALRERIAARRALVDEGDYFALLGVSRDATSYDVRRAYLNLRRELDPGRILIAATIDLRDDLDTILEVLDEAYEILRDQLRRERYRRALETAPR
jgi:hypothetical protein